MRDIQTSLQKHGLAISIKLSFYNISCTLSHMDTRRVTWRVIVLLITTLTSATEEGKNSTGNRLATLMEYFYLHYCLSGRKCVAQIIMETVSETYIRKYVIPYEL